MGLVNAVCAIKNGYHANLGNGANSGYACIASRKVRRKIVSNSSYYINAYCVFKTCN